jgi:hypothetical protein
VPQSAVESHRLSDSIIIAATAPIAFLFAFVFEAGYCSVFRIPLEFISVSLTNVFFAGASFILIGIFLIILIDLISMILTNVATPLNQSILTLAPLFLATLAFIFYAIGTPLSSSLLGFAIGWLVIIFLQFIFPLITQRGKPGYNNKLAGQARIEATGILGGLARRFRGPYLLIYYLAIALYITYFAGQSVAYRQREFLVTTTPPELVVLRIYGNRIIAVPFDSTTSEIRPEFTIMNLDDSDMPELRLVTLKPLTGVEKTERMPTPNQPTVTPATTPHPTP